MQRASERALFPVISVAELSQLSLPLGIKKKPELMDFPKRVASEACLTFKGIPFLHQYVILDISWFAEQFEKLFSHNRGYRFGYIVDYATLQAIFPQFHYEVISFLLKIAEYFSQIYEIIDDSALRYCRSVIFLSYVSFVRFHSCHHSIHAMLPSNLTGSVPKKDPVLSNNAKKAKVVERVFVGNPIKTSDYPFGGCQNSQVLIPALLSASRPVYQMVSRLLGSFSRARRNYGSP